MPTNDIPFFMLFICNGNDRVRAAWRNKEIIQYACQQAIEILCVGRDIGLYRIDDHYDNLDGWDICQDETVYEGMRGAVRYCICNFMRLSCISRLQCLVQTEISKCRCSIRSWKFYCSLLLSFFDKSGLFMSRPVAFCILKESFRYIFWNTVRDMTRFQNNICQLSWSL